MSDNYDEMSDGELADKFREHLAEEGLGNEHSIYPENEEGLGTAIESALSKMGITPERVERVFGIKECGCNERKKFLNKLFPFFKKTTEKDG
tara:strand:- start:1780 stop:2055 length:276 start_codon:yes stop_codon:yes gene_type:complete